MASKTSPLSDQDEIPAPDPRNVKLLKTVVIVLGVLLVLGTIVLISAIVYRASKLKSAPPAQGFSIESKLAPGSVIKSTEIDGDRMAVRVHSPTGEKIILYDIKKGLEIGRIELK